MVREERRINKLVINWGNKEDDRLATQIINNLKRKTASFYQTAAVMMINIYIFEQIRRMGKLSASFYTHRTA